MAALRVTVMIMLPPNRRPPRALAGGATRPASPARLDRRDLVEVVEPVIEERQRIRVALCLARGPEHGADQRHTVSMPGGDENVTGVGGVSGLDPVDPRHPADERVAVDDVADVIA